MGVLMRCIILSSVQFGNCYVFQRTPEEEKTQGESLIAARVAAGNLSFSSWICKAGQWKSTVYSQVERMTDVSASKLAQEKRRRTREVKISQSIKNYLVLDICAVVPADWIKRFRTME